MQASTPNYRQSSSNEQLVQGDLFEDLLPKKNQDPANQLGLFLAQVKATSILINRKCGPHFEALADFSRRVEHARAFYLKQLAA